MGIFDQLANLPQTPPVASPEPVKPPVADSSVEIPKHKTKPVVKRPPPVKEATISEANPKLLLDRPAIRQRITTRVAFDVYLDQMQVLRYVSNTAKLAGDNLSISEMVREALDSYLTAKN